MTSVLPLPIVQPPLSASDDIVRLMSSSAESIPQWIKDYAAWHAKMRVKFPDEQLLTHPSHPPLVIRACPALCNGLHDRMMGITQFLYDAFRTKRVLLIKWYKPCDLESFLVPASIINWTVPNVSGTETVEKLLKEFPFFDVTRNNNQSDSNDRIIVKHLHRFQEPPDNVEWPDFGVVWNLLFQPSPRLSQALEFSRDIRNDTYAALHLRVRHPAQYKRLRDLGADRNGLEWHKGKKRRFAVAVAMTALNCTKQVLRQEESVYIMSDSIELVNYLLHGVHNESSQQVQNEPWHPLALAAVDGVNLTSRDMTVPSGHLDATMMLDSMGQSETISWASYAATFVDLYVAIQARCIVVGVGNFAALAVKIANHSCIVQYAPREGDLARRWSFEQLADRAILCGDAL